MDTNELSLLDAFALQGQSNKLAKLAKSMKAAAVEGRAKSYVGKDLQELREIQRVVSSILDGSIYGR